jgi:hypothetical protein
VKCVPTACLLAPATEPRLQVAKALGIPMLVLAQPLLVDVSKACARIEEQLVRFSRQSLLADVTIGTYNTGLSDPTAK